MENGVTPTIIDHLHHRGQALGLPVAGTFELTARCNFNCKMCYVHLSEAEQRRRGRELTAAEWIDIGAQAKDAGMMLLLLTGGEPALRPDFPEIYGALHRMGFMVSVNSNGYLLQDHFVELFRKETPTRINITLYGTDNETYRRLCGVPAYDRIVNNIQTLRDAGIDVKINISLNPDNMDQMEALMEQAKTLGAHVQATPYMFPPIRVDPSRIGDNFRMTAEQAGEFQARYNYLAMSKEKFCLLSSQMARGIRPDTEDSCEGAPGRGMACRAGSSAFWLTWDGKLMPCGQMTEPAVDVMTAGFAAAWQEIRKATAAIRLPGECAGCGMNHVCHACAAMCYGETGRFDGKPDYLCRLNRQYMASTQELWVQKYGGEQP